jgi:hypothetical protein
MVCYVKQERRKLRPQLPLQHIGICLLAHAAVCMIALGNKSLRSRIPDASGYACNEDVFHGDFN